MGTNLGFTMTKLNTDILEVALAIEQKTRELEEAVNEQNQLISEILLLCQEYRELNT